MSAVVGRLPERNGDGYPYGGEWTVTIDGITLVTGAGERAKQLAERIASLDPPPRIQEGQGDG